MSDSFITRIEREKEEPYTVIFTTDDHDKYRHIEDECRKMIGHAKPIKAVKVRHGRWTDHRTIEHDGEWYCTACGEEVTICSCGKDKTRKYRYCPNCGAKMDGGADDG